MSIVTLQLTLHFDSVELLEIGLEVSLDVFQNLILHRRRLRYQFDGVHQESEIKGFLGQYFLLIYLSENRVLQQLLHNLFDLFRLVPILGQFSADLGERVHFHGGVVTNTLGS